MRIAPFIYVSLQGSTLIIFELINPDLFDVTKGQSIYLLSVIILSFVFYGFTSFRDPGYLPQKVNNVTEFSNQISQKRKVFNFQPLSSNTRTFPVLDQQAQVQEQKSENEQELACEASIDVKQLPEFDMNQIPSFSKTPDKYPSPLKNQNSKEFVVDFDNKQASTQAFSITSHNEQEMIVSNLECEKKLQNDESQQNHIQQPSSEGKRKSLKENQPGLVLQIQVHSVQNEFISEQYSPGMSERNKITQSTRSQIKLFIEKRYCRTCSIEQLVRTKHCDDCQRCVACFDHHCPWAGNCIGEKNKCVYYWFLMFQTQEIYFILIDTFMDFDFGELNLALKILTIYAIIVSIFFGALVTNLICFQTFISFQNLTTWEFHRWDKISYLQEIPKKNGSPFSYGWKQNLQYYCRFSIPQLTQWEYNPERVSK